MYRIELKPGEETVFRTIEEMATGIRHGLITPRARIFHSASQKWLPIEFHPHYKKAMNMPATKSGETPAIVVPSAPAPVAIFTPRPAPVPAFAPPPLAAPAVVSPVAVLPPVVYHEQVVEEIPLPAAYVSLDPPDAGRFRPIHLAIAAAVLLAGAYLALSAAAPSRRDSNAVAAYSQTPQPTNVLPATMQPVVPAPVVVAEKIDSSPPRPAAQVAARTGGPTFGPPAAPPAAPAARTRTMVTSIGASPPAPAATDSATAIEPAPSEVDLSVPSLPLGDSLAPAASTGSNAMGGILRAVSGEGVPAPRP